MVIDGSRIRWQWRACGRRLADVNPTDQNCHTCGAQRAIDRLVRALLGKKEEKITEKKLKERVRRGEVRWINDDKVGVSGFKEDDKDSGDGVARRKIA